jgi:peptide/nickel transport system substrate-binding protein
LALRLYAPTSRPYFAPTAEHIAGWLKRAGVDVTVRTMPNTQVSEQAAAGRFDLYLTAWNVSPDPDGVLSVQTCDRRPGPDGAGGSSDGFYCSAAYDEAYRRQLTEVDAGRRAELIRQLQQTLYDDVPVSTLYYPDGLEAYRSDHVGGMTARPATGRGSLIGRWAYVSATPVGAAPAGSGAFRVALAGGAVLMAGLVGAVVWRRRRGADDRR